MNLMARQPIFSSLLSCGLGMMMGLSISCTQRSSPLLISPEVPYGPIVWSPEESQQDIALKTLRQTPEASFHLIRLKGTERPHVHDHHDLTVFVLSGKARVHFATRSVEVGPLDIIEIPRGHMHWAENISPGPSVVYVIFTPPFDGKDHRLIETPT